MSGNVFDCHDLRGGVTTGISWAEATDAAKYLLMHTTTPPPQTITQPRISVVPRISGQELVTVFSMLRGLKVNRANEGSLKLVFKWMLGTRLSEGFGFHS